MSALRQMPDGGNNSVHANGVYSPDLSAIENFLRDTVRKAIQIVAIWPDGPVEGHWFGDDAARAARWAEEANARGCNLYWTINEVEPGTKVTSVKVV
jgi:hypothetical protein